MDRKASTRLQRAASKVVADTAVAVEGAVSALSARLLHATVEGLAFLWTQPGARCFVLVHHAVLMIVLGPGRAVPLTVQCAAACCLYRGVQVLLHTSSAEAVRELSSVWDWEPPDDAGYSGAWSVLRMLALTISQGGEHIPALRALPPVPAHELAVRLAFLFRHHCDLPAADNLTEEEQAAVPAGLVEELGRYLFFADQAYEAETEASLAARCASRGFALNHARMEPTWGEHCPAYFVATSTSGRELLVAIRGTWSAEDVITDLAALPEEFDGRGIRAHSGMGQAAVWLAGRVQSLAELADSAGYTVTLLGHSLGAGAAALVAMLLKARGVRRVRCFAYAPPACCEAGLARACADYVTSVVFADDIVPRFSQEAVAEMYKEALAFDWETAAAEQGLHPALATLALLSRTIAALPALPALPLLVSAVAAQAPTGDGVTIDGKGGHAKADEDKTDGERRMEGYDPWVPGRVLYIARQPERREEQVAATAPKAPAADLSAAVSVSPFAQAALLPVAEEDESLQASDVSFTQFGSSAEQPPASRRSATDSAPQPQSAPLEPAGNRSITTCQRHSSGSTSSSIQGHTEGAQGSGSGRADSAAGALAGGAPGGGAGGGLVRALVDGGHPALRRLRLSRNLLADHLCDAYFDALGARHERREAAEKARLEAEKQARDKQPPAEVVIQLGPIARRLPAWLRAGAGGDAAPKPAAGRRQADLQLPKRNFATWSGARVGASGRQGSAEPGAREAERQGSRGVLRWADMPRQASLLASAPSRQASAAVCAGAQHQGDGQQHRPDPPGRML